MKELDPLDNCLTTWRQSNSRTTFGHPRSRATERPWKMASASPSTTRGRPTILFRLHQTQRTVTIARNHAYPEIIQLLGERRVHIHFNYSGRGRGPGCCIFLSSRDHGWNLSFMAGTVQHCTISGGADANSLCTSWLRKCQAFHITTKKLSGSTCGILVARY